MIPTSPQKLITPVNSDQVHLSIKEQKEQLPEWYSRASILEKNDCSRLHMLQEAFVVGGDNVSIKDSSPLTSAALKEYKIFVVKNNWAAAFKGAKDYESNNMIRLPFEKCVFEFRISGRTVLVVANQDPVTTGIKYLFFVKLNVSVALTGCDDEEINGIPYVIPRLPTTAEPHLVFALSQIKAICVALDAQVAVHEVIRAPYKLNIKRIQKGKLPLNEYHIVNLAHRTRVSRTEQPVATGRHVRLHFRRGHWRHYVNHKTWIHWMLVGDPDLGWIDKEYSL